MINLDFNLIGGQFNERATGEFTVDPSQAEPLSSTVSNDFTVYRNAISRGDFSITDSAGEGRLFGDTEVPYDSYIGIANDTDLGDVLVVSFYSAFFVFLVPGPATRIPPFVPVPEQLPPNQSLHQQQVLALFTFPDNTFSSESLEELNKVDSLTQSSASTIRAFNTLADDVTVPVISLTGTAVVSGPGLPGPPVIPPPDDSNPSVISGTTRNDRLRGTSASDRIEGLGGNDRITGLAGDDTILGGGGRDRLNGGAGDDTLLGGKGSDRLSGKSGNDILSGGKGSDRYVGGKGNDIFNLQTGSGRDIIRDFEQGTDRLGLSNGLSFEALDFTRRGKNTLVSVNGDAIALIEDARPRQFTSADFI
ncbi:MAG: hypothetical protein AAGD25_28320 [Cyanobacteria bacterium P01_F01_bin.150]